MSASIQAWTRVSRKMFCALGPVLLVSTLLAASAAHAAPGPVTVSLTFDDNVISQYNLAFNAPGALKDSAVPATFFVNSGTIGGGPGFMTWDQVSALAAAGNAIGGKTVNSGNLTTDPSPTTQVCQDRQNLLAHGITPAAFAYPGGAINATVEGVVKNCGYGNGRGAGGLGPEPGAPNSQAVPPSDWFATSSYAPPSTTLANLQSIVTNSNSKGGGWTQVVIGNVCDQTLDATNYAACSSSWGHVELQDLESFLTWVKNAGQANTAPAGTTFATVGQVARNADHTAPTTTITCNGAACVNSYSGTVTITLTATDNGGSGVASTHYTTDGTDPTLSSPTYIGPFGLNGATTTRTLKFRSWDLAGNVEATTTRVILAPRDTTAPVTTIACNTAPCAATPYPDSVSVSLTATDSGSSASGVARTYYTTDGTTPTTSSTVYTAPFSLPLGVRTVKFFSVDYGGNSESAKSQVISVVAHATTVSLTFDDGTLGQYHLAFQQALQPHNAHATFFLNSGTVGFGQTMLWPDVAALAAAGNDIGAKSVSASDLSKLDPENVKPQVCDDRTNFISHGVTPTAFAYPGGVFNAALESVVAQCGYGNARTAQGLGPEAGAPNAETIPPADWLATKAYAPGDLTLANMQSIVTNAQAKGGGWTQIVIGRVCDATLDPVNYPQCSAAGGHLQLSDLNAFLDWMANAGNPGGAPSGVGLATVASVSAALDTAAPVTTIACNNGPCASVTFTSSQGVSVSLAPTDVGSGPASTRYTTDGTDPTALSPLYSGPFTVPTTSTVKFRTTDRAGLVEPVKTQVVTIQPGPDGVAPTTTISCNGANCTAGAYPGAVRIAFSPVDNLGGWGPDKTYYTLDGSTPTSASPVYTAAFYVSINSTIRFFSSDLAGNSETPQQYVLSVTPVTTNISLTFDDGISNQYSLAYLHALQPHGVHGTFFINTGGVGTDDGIVTYPELTEMQANGQDIGGHTVDHLNLTNPALTQQDKIDQVCNDRQALIANGLTPQTFAYPEGAFDASVQSIVANCGYTSARSAGGITPIGPNYSEKSPPPDRFGILAWSPPGGKEITLADLQSVVNQSARHGQGWVPIVGHQVCDQTLDPDNYAFCKAEFGSMELSTLNAFLDWIQQRGTPNGAPAGSVARSMREVLSNDNVAPTTTIRCNNATCPTTPFFAPVTVRLTATDNSGGTGVSRTYYTTDGSVPTTASTRYTGTFTVSQTTTVRYFSTDNAGNAELPKSQTITVLAPDFVAPTSSIACNGAPCSGWYRSTVTVALSAVDNPGGSGVTRIYYTTNGSTPTTSSTVYTAPFTVNQPRTIRFFAVDFANNTEVPKSQSIQFDSTAPTSSISCNGAACASTFYTSAVTATIAATDTGGSGLAQIFYTTDGSTPTTASNVYTAAIVLSSTTTVRYFATDTAGNAQSSRSQTIRVDTGPPVVAITSPADNASVRRGTQITVSATASDGSGILMVSFALDGVPFSMDFSAPYSVNRNVPNSTALGAHTLTAVATDMNGQSTTSAPVTIQVTT